VQNTIASIIAQDAEPQIITGSHDSTIRLWDIRKGDRAKTCLTNHKKAIRAMVAHKKEYTFLSGAADNIKKWQCPEGKFLKNFAGHNAIINSMALNDDGVLFSGADNGSMRFWDWRTGYCFQKDQAKVQPGSLDSEAGIFASTFDKSSTRLITCEADKTVKIWCEDETATPETHPVDMAAWTAQSRQRKRY
tara:strand:+ start:283 stop:855 length:573 start_codon:yes stop_codon:yes gene_type:complete